MRKKTLFYSLGLATLGITLASCGTRDYKAKDFNITAPEKNSSATVAYESSEAKGELITFYHKRASENIEGNETVKEDFFKEYKSIMATYTQESSLTDDSKVGNGKLEQKSIYDTVNNNIYYYEHIYSTIDENNYDCTIESNAYFNEGKYTVLTDITLKDLPFNPTDALYYQNKATGKLKYTYTYDYSDKTDEVMDMLFNMATNPNIANTLSNQYEDSCIVYTNEDKSYLYSTYTQEARNKENELISKLDQIKIKENYLNTYSGYQLYSKDLSTNKVLEGSYGLKMEYIKDSVLDSNYNVDGYTPFDVNLINSGLNDLMNLGKSLPFVATPYTVGSIVMWYSTLIDLLSNNESLTEGLTITTIEK